MKASIIIPAYNAERTIGTTVESCLSQHFPHDEYEVIVVDDGSTDATAKKVQQFPVKYIEQDNTGAAAARNVGADIAQGHYMVFVDADCIPTEDVLQSLVDALDDDPRLGIVGGIYARTTDGSLIARAICEEIRRRHLCSPHQVEHIGSFCMAIKHHLFSDVGGFDARFRRGQDQELSNRVARQGYKLRVLKNVEVTHDHPRTLSSWLQNQYYQAYWRTQSALCYSNVLKGDGYVNYRDWLSLLLGIATIALLPFAWFPWIWRGIIACLAASAVLHIPDAVFAIRDTGDWRQVVIIPMQVLRGCVWGIGAISGAIAHVSRPLIGRLGETSGQEGG